MAIKINSNTVIDDSKNFTVADITFADATVQASASSGGGGAGVEVAYNAGDLMHTLLSDTTNLIGGYLSSAVYDNILVLGNSGLDTVLAFDLETGQRLWKTYNVSNNFGYRVVIFNGRLMVYDLASIIELDLYTGTIINTQVLYLGAGNRIAANDNFFVTATSGGFGVYAEDSAGDLVAVGSTTAPDPSHVSFGQEIILTDDNILIVSSGFNVNWNGTVYVYDLNSESLFPAPLLATIDPPWGDILPPPNPYTENTEDGDDPWFGYVMAYDKATDTLAIASPWEDDPIERGNFFTEDSGMVYLYDLAGVIAGDPTGDVLKTILSNPNASNIPNGDNFGSTMSASNGYLAVQAEGELVGSSAVYIFDLNNLGSTEPKTTILHPEGSRNFGRFGNELNIVGNILYGSANGYYADSDYCVGFLVAMRDIYNLNSIQSISFSNGITIDAGNQLLEFTNSGLGSGVTFNRTLDNPNDYSTSNYDNFGRSVAISGNYAIVGAYAEDDSYIDDDDEEVATYSGVAYIFDVTTGTLLHTLDNPNARGTPDNDRFGWSVAISRNYAIVGAYQEDDSASNSGKAYIFDVLTGNLVHTLDNPNAGGSSANDFFGASVSISGNYAIVGAYNVGFNSGKAYIFDVTTGSLLHTLDNPTAYSTSAGDYFGWSVAISDNYAIVGAYLEDDAGGSASGKAYIFDVTTGNLLHTLDNPNAFSTSAGDYFGHSVAISGNYAIVGAINEDDSRSDSGKAYIFDVTTGNLVHMLHNPNAYSTSTYDNFGSSVAISGNYAVVGAHFEDDAGGTNSGKVYIFNVASGELLHTLDNPNAYSTSYIDEFGYSVAISGDYVIAGVPNELDSLSAPGSGVAYIFGPSAKPISKLEKLLDSI